MAEATFSAILLPARNHFEQTIQNTVQASLLREYLPANLANDLADATGTRGIPTWGLTPGANGQHVGKWDRLRIGDYGVFTGEGAAFAVARLIGKEHNASLARRLWGEDEQGMTWEYLLFFRRVMAVTPPLTYEKLARTLGFKENFVPLGAMVVEPERAAELVLALDPKRSLSGSDRKSENSESGPNDRALDPDALASLLDLDAKHQTQHRKEQTKIRALLLGKRKTGLCAFCGQEFPAELLVAAHIKKRADCSDTEKRDFSHNVILMCTFGCDDLFERGFLIVKNGKLDAGRVGEATPAVTKKVSFMRGQAVKCWSPSTAPYFEAHRARVSLANSGLDEA